MLMMYFLGVSPGLINRVSMADINFNKEMELAPRVSPEFELTLDNTPCIHTIENMNFFQMKAHQNCNEKAWGDGN
nr:hypothetical protein BaRGS_033950 [Batillaria attramentaria]